MATKRITNESVRAAKPAEGAKKDAYLWDDKLSGFGLKTTPKGAKSFVYSYRMEGGRDANKRRTTIGGVGEFTADEARKRAAQLARLVADGIDPRRAKEDRQREQIELAFDRYAGLFIDEYLKVRWRGGWKIAAGYLRCEAIPHFKDRPITQITAGDVSALMRKMAGRVATRRNTFSVLRKLFRWAIGEGDLAETPMRYMEPPPSPAARERVLETRELATIWKAADRIGYPFGSFVQVLMLTGQRREEVAALSWSELDQAARAWTLPSARAKNNKAHWVPLADQAMAVFDSAARLQLGLLLDATDPVSWPRKGWVFTANGEKPVTGYSFAKKHLDKAIAEILAERVAEGGTASETMAEWRFHDLRRTLATGFQQQGSRFEVTEAMLNHVGMSRKGVAGVYQKHEWADEKRVEIEKWGQHIGLLAAA